MFAFLDGDAATLAIVAELFAVDAAYREVLSFGVVDEQATHGGRGLNAVVVGQRDVQFLFSLQPVEDDALKRMVRASGVAEGNSQRADPL